MLKKNPFDIITILGVPVSALDMMTALDTLNSWIRDDANRYVCAADVYNVSSANTDHRHMAALRDADMVVPDGTPLS